VQFRRFLCDFWIENLCILLSNFLHVGVPIAFEALDGLGIEEWSSLAEKTAPEEGHSTQLDGLPVGANQICAFYRKFAMGTATAISSSGGSRWICWGLLPKGQWEDGQPNGGEDKSLGEGEGHFGRYLVREK
jgi:hypothetical protein